MSTTPIGTFGGSAYVRGVAALYIDPKGPYPGLVWPQNVWTKERDARLYCGPHPVVAHPPCGPWGALRHQYTGDEHDCALRAVEQVRTYGGVLEHPAGSLLWQHCSLPERVFWYGTADRWLLQGPIEPDRFGGFSFEVEQVEWGHVARKRTWLYVVGLKSTEVGAAIARKPFPDRAPTHWVSGRKFAEALTAKARANGWTGGAAPPGIKICSAQQRRRTPVAFAEMLLSLAALAGRTGAA